MCTYPCVPVGCDALSVAASDRTAGCRRFKCNMCGQLNEVMAEHFSPTGDGGLRMDVDQHPQLSHGSVEFIAPTEYMVRLCEALSSTEAEPLQCWLLSYMSELFVLPVMG